MENNEIKIVCFIWLIVILREMFLIWKKTCYFNNHKWKKLVKSYYCEKCGLCKVTENAK
jgi:hypothetical protein